MKLGRTTLAASVALGGVLACAAPGRAMPKPGGLAQALARQESAAKIQKGLLLKTIPYDSQEYRYVLYVPADYDGSKSYPLILFLHGAGECGRDGLKSVAVGIGPALMLDADKWPFLVLIPQKPEIRQDWEQWDTMLIGMIDATKRDFKVDASRLYLTGLSQGGHGTWAIAAKHPDLFAAIAPICGWGDKSTATALKSTPVWAFHGDKDTAVPHERSEEMVRAVKDAGGDATLTLYPGVGHNSWDKAYREEKLYEWLLKHKREKPTNDQRPTTNVNK